MEDKRRQIPVTAYLFDQVGNTFLRTEERIIPWPCIAIPCVSPRADLDIKTKVIYASPSGKAEEAYLTETVEELYRRGDSGLQAPNYDLLSNVELILDPTGHEDEGDAARTLTAWKSIAPGPTGRDFTPNGTAGRLTVSKVNGINVVDNHGKYFTGPAANLRNTGGAATWDFLNYHEDGISSLKWTQYIVMRAGFLPDPNDDGKTAATAGIIGNTATASSTKGFGFWYDDRTTQSANKRVMHQITRGVSSSFISTNSTNSEAKYNEVGLLVLVYDGSIATAADRFKAFWNGVQIPLTVTSGSTAIASLPTHDLELFAVGNGVFPMDGQMSHVIIQSTVEEAETRQAFINTLTPWVDRLRTWSSSANGDKAKIYDILADSGKYYFNVVLSQHPVSKDTILCAFTLGDEHGVEPGKSIYLRRSVDRGKTFSEPVLIHTPEEGQGVQGIGGGYDNSGRFHIILGEHNLNGDQPRMVHIYSDDNGDSFTEVDITSVLPSDGMSGFRAYGNLIDNAGVLMFPFYKFTAEQSTESTANYLLRSTDGGSSWAVAPVRTNMASEYINEATIIALNETKLLYISRYDEEVAWRLFESLDNGVTWTDKGTIDFGEDGITSPVPGRLAMFHEGGQDYVAFYYPIRSTPGYTNDRLRAVYARKSDLINDSTAWNPDTKSDIIWEGYCVYGTVIHPWNDRGGIGGYALGPNSGDNKVILFNTNTYHIDSVIATLNQ